MIRTVTFLFLAYRLITSAFSPRAVTRWNALMLVTHLACNLPKRLQMTGRVRVTHIMHIAKLV
jgi:hypothetical protein